MRVFLLACLLALAGCGDDDNPVDAAAPDAPAAIDAAAPDAAVTGCAEVTATCAGSIWADWFSPFTAQRCEEVLACVHDLFTADCQTRLATLTACMATLSVPADCDTQCATEVTDVASHCPCPAACGVACWGSDAGP